VKEEAEREKKRHYPFSDTARYLNDFPELGALGGRRKRGGGEEDGEGWGKEGGDEEEGKEGE
jgi:hypothetical protein